MKASEINHCKKRREPKFTQEDITHIQFIHDRMIEVHKEHKFYDYMNALRRIINKMKEDQ